MHNRNLKLDLMKPLRKKMRLSTDAQRKLKVISEENPLKRQARLMTVTQWMQNLRNKRKNVINPPDEIVDVFLQKVRRAADFVCCCSNILRVWIRCGFIQWEQIWKNFSEKKSTNSAWLQLITKNGFFVTVIWITSEKNCLCKPNVMVYPCAKFPKSSNIWTHSKWDWFHAGYLSWSWYLCHVENNLEYKVQLLMYQPN